MIKTLGEYLDELQEMETRIYHLPSKKSESLSEEYEKKLREKLMSLDDLKKRIKKWFFDNASFDDKNNKRSIYFEDKDFFNSINDLLESAEEQDRSDNRNHSVERTDSSVSSASKNKKESFLE